MEYNYAEFFFNGRPIKICSKIRYRRKNEFVKITYITMVGTKHYKGVQKESSKIIIIHVV